MTGIPKKPVLALGLMSGTSVDAIDVSLVRLGPKTDELLLHCQYPFDAPLRAEILAMIRDPAVGLRNFTRIHYEIGSAFALASERTIAAARKRKLLKAREDVAVIGSHGQTVYHDPEGKRTLQIGEASLIAARTGITTVSDFRTADTAQGGEGAPLIPWYHRRLFAKLATKGVAVHNLGGISNYTYVGPRKTIFALDTGPANCLIDSAIQKFSEGELAYDNDGQVARLGRILPELMAFLKDKSDIAAFRLRHAPKSTGRELFSAALLEEVYRQFPHRAGEDLLRTLTQFTADLILESFDREIFHRKLPLSRVVFAGGGARNSFLLSLLREKLPKVQFQVMEDYGWNSQALESQAFAAFAWLALQGEPITLPTTTGAKKPAVCGKISPGTNWANLAGKKQKR
jgi:anhydro-N-acetylmuramic acid kinase